MNDLQKRTAQAIVNIFESGRVSGDYGAVTLLKGDSGHLTYGRSQTTLGSGNLFLLIKAYCERADASYATELRPFLGDLAARNMELDNNGTLREILQEAGNDPAMRREQDRFFDAHYYQPAIKAAQARGVTLPLGQSVVYDSLIHGGFGKVTPLVGAATGPGALDERRWIEKYIAARKTWLSGLPPPLPKTVYRMDAFQKLINEGAWDLPLNLTIRGVVISPESLTDSTDIIRATAADPADPPAPQILFLSSPHIRGEAARRVQEALHMHGFFNSRDGVFGPSTEALVMRFQKSKGLRADGVVGPATRTALGL